MNGLNTAAPGYLVVKIPKGWPGPVPEEGGFDEYKMPPPGLEELAVIEQYLMAGRVNPVDAVLPTLENLEKIGTPAALRMAEHLASRAYEDLRKTKEQQRLSMGEVWSWMESPVGARFSTKLCLQRFHPDITDAEVNRIFNWMGEEEVRRLSRQMQGIDALGNSTGASEANSTAPAPSPGEESTGGSPASTDGAPPLSAA